MVERLTPGFLTKWFFFVNVRERIYGQHNPREYYLNLCRFVNYASPFTRRSHINTCTRTLRYNLRSREPGRGYFLPSQSPRLSRLYFHSRVQRIPCAVADLLSFERPEMWNMPEGRKKRERERERRREGDMWWRWNRVTGVERWRCNTSNGKGCIVTIVRRQQRSLRRDRDSKKSDEDSENTSPCTKEFSMLSDTPNRRSKFFNTPINNNGLF